MCLSSVAWHPQAEKNWWPVELIEWCPTDAVMCHRTEKVLVPVIRVVVTNVAGIQNDVPRTSLARINRHQPRLWVLHACCPGFGRLIWKARVDRMLHGPANKPRAIECVGALPAALSAAVGRTSEGRRSSEGLATLERSGGPIPVRIAIVLRRAWLGGWWNWVEQGKQPAQQAWVHARRVY
jgi:hypothetical protein